MFFFFKQKTAYEIRNCDWSSDVCSSDLQQPVRKQSTRSRPRRAKMRQLGATFRMQDVRVFRGAVQTSLPSLTPFICISTPPPPAPRQPLRSEFHFLHLASVKRLPLPGFEPEPTNSRGNSQSRLHSRPLWRSVAR